MKRRKIKKGDLFKFDNGLMSELWLVTDKWEGSKGTEHCSFLFYELSGEHLMNPMITSNKADIHTIKAMEDFIKNGKLTRVSE